MVPGSSCGDSVLCPTSPMGGGGGTSVSGLLSVPLPLQCGSGKLLVSSTQPDAALALCRRVRLWCNAELSIMSVSIYFLGVRFKLLVDVEMKLQKTSEQFLTLSQDEEQFCKHSSGSQPNRITLSRIGSRPAELALSLG